MFFLKIVISFVLYRKFGNIIHDFARKYNGQFTVSDFRRLEKLQNKVRKAELDITFLRNCQVYNVYPNFLCFNIPHTNRVDERSIRKRLLRGAINKREKEKNKLVKELKNHSEFINKVLSGVDWYIL